MPNFNLFSIYLNQYNISLIQQGIPFVDDSFPPAAKSLYSKPRHSDHPRVTQWLRPDEIDNFRHERSKLSWAVFRHPRPSDIMQGVLGDCWYVILISIILLLHNIGYWNYTE